MLPSAICYVDRITMKIVYLSTEWKMHLVYCLQNEHSSQFSGHYESLAVFLWKKKRMRTLKYFMFTILRRLCLSWTKGTAMLHVVMKKWLLLLAPYAKYIQQRGWLCVIVCPRKSHIYVSKWNVLHCVNCGDAIQLSNLKGSLTRALFLPLA